MLTRTSSHALVPFLAAVLSIPVGVSGCSSDDDGASTNGTATGGSGGNGASPSTGAAAAGNDATGGSDVLGGTGAAPATGGASPTGGSDTGAPAEGGSGGTTEGEGSGTGGGSVAEPTEDLIVDDFEDGDGVPSIEGGWYTYTDQDNGGGSVLTISEVDGEIAMTGEGFESVLSLQMESVFDQGELTYEPYVGLGAWLSGSSDPLDLSQYAGIAYDFRGGAHTVRVDTYDVADYDYHGVAVPAASSWTRIEIAFDELMQEGWGEEVAFDPSNVAGISFHLRGETGETTTFQLDNLTVLLNPPEPEPDLVVHDSEPPEDDVLESLAISNPLQAQAMATLNRGYNVTNWLEQDRFDGFTYDEQFVTQLAAAGFESLRLPIDLDLYVEERSGSGDEMTLELHEDLFTILDSFAEWTEAAGLSLTIDYHQYDHSFDIADPDGVAEMVELWSRVAEHFADNPREDLYYELLNEPELSAVDDNPPTATEWTELAEAMITAIRVHDATRTLIFGDVEWYGIGALIDREPLRDPNVIYAFHFYDPFLFTHQGASWTALGSAHDIPYPYAPERWSEYSAELGLSRISDSWVQSLIDGYYQDGHRSALRNRLIQAKRWAVENDVPIVCNEFGAYDATSTLEDRQRYYSDLVGLFAELEIPWQHWFMIMDDQGEVIPEYREAFGLAQ